MSIIKDDVIALAPIVYGELPEIYRMNMDYDIAVGGGFWVDMPTYKTFRNWMEEYIESINKTKCHMAILPKENVYSGKRDSSLYGVVSALEMSDYHRTAEISIRIKKEGQGKGIAKKAIALMLEYLFNIRGYRKVYAQIFSTNDVSKKLFTQMGFEHEATLVKQEMHLGEYTDVDIYVKWKSNEEK